MIRVQLISHPTTPLPQVRSLDVVLATAGDGLTVAFDCRCAPGALRLAPRARGGGPRAAAGRGRR